MTALSIAASLLAARPARGQDTPAPIVELERQALVAYDDLDFAKARSLLERSLAEEERAGLAEGAFSARTHLFLGMVLLGGFSLRDAATAQFKIALGIQPGITPPAGLFNPETDALFRAARRAASRARQEPDKDADDEEESTSTSAAAPARRRAPKAPRARAVSEEPAEEAEVEKEGEPPAAPTALNGSFLIALALGSGGGTATGRLDMQGVSPSTAPGGFARSETVHTTLGIGYFWSRSSMLSVEGRLQLVTGATPHCQSATSCSSTADSAFAAFAKVTHLFSDGAARPFLTAGLGGGAIRQRVMLKGLPDCGRSGDQQCFDTVAGGPIFGAAGAGIAYQAGPLLLQGAVTANVGFPSFMLNVDVTLGVGLLL